MLKWREDYYVGEGIKDAAKARRRIDAGRVAFGVYLVTLSENPGNLLEIVPSYMLIQNLKKKMPRRLSGEASRNLRIILMRSGRS